jgi:hypothetical protein
MDLDLARGDLLPVLSCATGEREVGLLVAAGGSAAPVPFSMPTSAPKPRC